jgi:hypothetical protein
VMMVQASIQAKFIKYSTTCIRMPKIPTMMVQVWAWVLFCNYVNKLTGLSGSIQKLTL